MNDTKELKYTEKAWEEYWTNHIGLVWKLLPMFEKNEDWQKDIPSIVLTVNGAKYLIGENPNAESRLILISSKLLGLLSNEEFTLHRKTVFEIITLIEELKEIGERTSRQKG